MEKARLELIEAFHDYKDLEKLTVMLEDGHELSLEDLHRWLSFVIEEIEKKGPRQAALNTLSDFLRSQPSDRN